MSLLHGFAKTSTIFLHRLSMPIAVDLSLSLLSYIHSSWFLPISSVFASTSCSVHRYSSHLASCQCNLASLLHRYLSRLLSLALFFASLYLVSSYSITCCLRYLIRISTHFPSSHLSSPSLSSVACCLMHCILPHVPIIRCQNSTFSSQCLSQFVSLLDCSSFSCLHSAFG